jgi:formylglycine-generating enzyme required for sulfatase activity
MSSRAASLMLVMWATTFRTDVIQAQAPTLTNDIGMEFVLVSPGSMLVGRFLPECPRPSPNAASRDQESDPRTRWTREDYARCEAMVKRDAMPGFTVTIPRAYYIGKYEVTQEQWRRVMGSNPSVFQGSKVQGNAERHPVDNVTWADAQEFVRRLNAMDTTARYRLPTEFEWEYAARAGATGEPSWDEIRASAWQGDVDLGTTHPVGGKKANAWGLHDALGNVWEWVADVYNEKLFADPVPPRTGTTHVLKGGSFVSDVKNATWSTHAGGPGSGFDVGFRIVRELR